jgi:hypothetical protein
LIAALIWGSCGAPIQDVWELEEPDESGAESADIVAVVDIPSGITSGVLRDEEHGLAVDIPGGWRAWPGPPDSKTRLHLEHAMTGASVLVHYGAGLESWPVRKGCAWNVPVSGLSSGLKHRGEVDSAVCWPEIPGDSRLLAWRLLDYEEQWVVEAKIPGGSAGLVDEALDALLPSIAFD